MKLTNRAKSALATAGYSVNENSAIAQLVAFAAQNSGIEFGNYGDRRAYAQECRSITKDWKRFKLALMLARAEGVTDKDVIAEAPHTFSGRLTWEPVGNKGEPDRGFMWGYTTGQYFPTEYRKAAASVVEAAIRRVKQARPPETRKVASIAELQDLNARNGGCWFDRSAMRAFGTRIESGVIRGAYFITSEQPPYGPRKYSVRQFDEKGHIWTVGGFNTLPSKAAALAAVPQE